MDDMNNFLKQLKKDKFSNAKMPRMPRGAATAGIGAAVLLGAASLGGVLLWNSFYSVEGGFRAIKFNRFKGVLEQGWDEGIHFMIPFIERPVIYNVRTRPQIIQSLTGSRDLQMVNISLRVLHKPDRNQLHTIYRTLGMDYDERVLPSIGNEVLKSVVAQFNASELLTKRAQVSKEIHDKLTQRASEFNIVLDDVSVTHLGFGKEYTAAVEAKQVAQQEAERAKILVEKASQETRSQIVKAEGEAEAAKKISEAMRDNPGFLALRKIEAALDIADVLSKSQNKVYANSDSLLINLYKSMDINSDEMSAVSQETMQQE